MKDAEIPPTEGSFDTPKQSQIRRSRPVLVNDETTKRPLEQIREYYNRQTRILLRRHTKAKED